MTSRAKTLFCTSQHSCNARSEGFQDARDNTQTHLNSAETIPSQQILVRFSHVEDIVTTKAFFEGPPVEKHCSAALNTPLMHAQKASKTLATTLKPIPTALKTMPTQKIIEQFSHVEYVVTTKVVFEGPPVQKPCCAPLNTPAMHAQKASKPTPTAHKPCRRTRY